MNIFLSNQLHTLRPFPNTIFFIQTIPLAPQPTVTQLTRHVTHDVPISLVPRRMWGIYVEPRLSTPFNASVYLPPIRTLRHVLDRMKVGVKLGTLLMQSYVSPPRKFDVTSLTNAVGLWHRLVVLVCVEYSACIQ